MQVVDYQDGVYVVRATHNGQPLKAASGEYRSVW